MTSYKNQSKYPYAPLKDGAFFFPTDEGCYIIVVVEEASYHLWQSDFLTGYDNVFSFHFERSCDDGYHDLDDSVCNTIYKIITSNMESKGHLCVYYHHWTEQGDYYGHFYSHFYDEMEYLIPDFEAFEFPWMDEVGNPGVTSVFIHKGNPDKELIVSEFRKTIELP